jgi:transcriptional regulator of acetoin/glycerol metabolism
VQVERDRALSEDLAPRPKRPPVLRRNGIADLTLDSALKRHVHFVLDYTGGHLSWAADELGVSPSTVYRWLKRWGWPAPRE